MKALVIGGTRFFGKRLVQNLLAENIEVTLMNRGQTPDDFGMRVHRINLDRRELSATRRDLQERSWDIIYDQVCYDAIEARGACLAFKDRCSHYVFTSTVSVYDLGADIGEEAYDPRSFSSDKMLTRDENYGIAKRQAEAVFFNEMECPVTAVRFPFVLGNDDYTARLKFHAERIVEQRPIYFPNSAARISFISSEDAASFLVALSQKSIQGPINCASEVPVALSDLIAGLEVILARKAVLVSDKALGESSPYGVENDWWMNTERLKHYGFKCKKILENLESLL